MSDSAPWWSHGSEAAPVKQHLIQQQSEFWSHRALHWQVDFAIRTFSSQIIKHLFTTHQSPWPGVLHSWERQCRCVREWLDLSSFPVTLQGPQSITQSLPTALYFANKVSHRSGIWVSNTGSQGQIGEPLRKKGLQGDYNAVCIWRLKVNCPSDIQPGELDATFPIDFFPKPPLFISFHSVWKNTAYYMMLLADSTMKK